MGRHTVRVPRRSAWPGRAVLAAAVAVAAALTAGWAGLDPVPALLVGVGAAAVVLGAAWLSATLPHRPADTPADTPPDGPTRTPHGSGAAGGDPVQ